MKHTLKFVLLGSLFFLAGCASFTGIRTPKYDGEPISIDEEASQLYADSYQIHPDYTDKYFRYELSETLFDPSEPLSTHGPVILEEGTYVVGEDIEAGRAFMVGEPSNFSADARIFHTGNLTITDEEGLIAFESHFQDYTGIMQAVVDLREGQTIELTGNDPIITVTYEEPDLGSSYLEAEEAIELITGHYEVGEHLEAGTYTIESFAVPRTAAVYRFSQTGEVFTYELNARFSHEPQITQEENENYFKWGLISEEEYEENNDNLLNQVQDKASIELVDGDKLYLPMIHSLVLSKEN
ncbi:hypothetical protein GCM10008932_19000 [Alkalibacterium iburiense]|uniref:Uncharacterized protein n=1 Tax=Alkalibacterium iburiense TaxID=290589 RepID=A0ABN0XLI0_9LACT